MLNKVRKQIATHGLLESGQPVVVGLSGGADSVVLLHMLNSLGYECIAAHCNYGLRGDESDRDERHALSVSAGLGVKCEVIRFDVADQRLPGESVEMTCRRLRYDWFAQLAERYCAQAVAVGHHREDNVETFMLNLLRRGGIDGLRGMLPRTPNGVVRPLLRLSRAEIESYAADNRLEYVTDHTNLENEYKRNRLRNIALPALRSCGERVDEAIEASMDHLRDAAELLAEVVEERRSAYGLPNGGFNVGELAAREPRHSGYLLMRMLSSQSQGSPTADKRTVEQILEAARRGRSGRMFTVAGRNWLLDRGKLNPVDERSEDTDHFVSTSLEIPSAPRTSATTRAGRWSLETELHTCGEPGAPQPTDADGRLTICLDSEAATAARGLIVRPWRKGDRMVPYGMKGRSRLVSDILTDAKFSLEEKKATLLLVSEEKVLWVIGTRASQHYAVTPSTGSLLFIRAQVLPEED